MSGQILTSPKRAMAGVANKVVYVKVVPSRIEKVHFDKKISIWRDLEPLHTMMTL